MEGLKYNVWDSRRIKEQNEELPLTDDFLKRNGFTKGGDDDRLTIYKNGRQLRCDILWENLRLKKVKDLKDLYNYLEENYKRHNGKLFT